jgi:hypothetical protein
MLKEANWELLENCTDANNAYDLFNHIFTKFYDKAFPKVEIKPNKKE